MLTEAQLAMRREGMSASDTAAIFGLDPFKGPFDVYCAKVDGWSPARTEDMARGDHLEDGVARWYAEKYASEVTNPNETLRHRTRPLILATPDRLATTSTGAVELVSIKVPRSGDGWGESETQDFPGRHVIQLNHEAAVLTSLGHTLAGAWLVAPVWGDLRRYPVRLDTELQDKLLTGCETFWTKYVATKLPPPIDGGAGARAWLQRRFPRATEGKTKAEASLAQESLCMALREAEARLDEASEKYETAKSRVLATMGAAYGLTGNFGSITNADNKWGKRTLRARWAKENK